VICTHVRIIERSHRQPGRVIYDWRHYLAVVQRKLGALRLSRQICFSNRLPGNERCAVRGNARSLPTIARFDAAQAGW
jgi:hypothetical protein